MTASADAAKSHYLSDRQVESFRTQGYLRIDGVVTGAQLEKLRAVTEDFVERSRRVSKSDEHFDLEPGHSAEQPLLRRLTNPVALHEAYRDVALAGPIPAIVAELFGRAMKFHHSKLNLKTSKVGSEVKWHQDYPYFPHTNFDLCAVGLALDDATVENGCVMFVPASHLGKLYSHFDRDENFVGAITDDLDPELLASARPVELPAGSISVHHGVTIHGSAPNRSPAQRRLLINQYAAADAFALTSNPIPSNFDGRVVAGEASKFARLESALVRVPPDWSRGYTSLFAFQSNAKTS